MSIPQRLLRGNDQLEMQDKRQGAINMLESLETSATSMRSITNSASIFFVVRSRRVNLLSISTNLLKSSLKGFDRMLKNTDFKRTHELITEADIQMSQNSIARDMLPQLKLLVNNIEIRLEKTDNSKKNLQRQVNIQDDQIRNISEERSRYNKSQLTQSGIQKSKVEKKRRILEATKESKQLQAKKARLISSLDQMDIDVSEKQHILQSIEQDIRDSKKLSQSAKDADNATNLKNLGLSQQKLSIELQRLKEKSKQSKLRLVKERQKANETPVQGDTEMKTKNNKQYDNEKWIAQEDQCLAHYQRSLENIIDLLSKASGLSFKASTTIIDAFKHQKAVYLESVEKDQDKITSIIIPACEEQEKHMLEKFIIKCKLLMPESAMAVTVVRVLETMLKRKNEQDGDSRSLAEILLERFPPRDERRHSFTRVASILKDAGIIELIPETDSNQAENKFYHCCLSRHL